jgi:hypothetical protein
VTYINDKYRANYDHEISFDEDFKKIPTLKNIIQCGIYDIHVNDEHVTICSNIEPLNESDKIKVDAEMLKLLKTCKFIQLDHEQIACLP